MDDKDIKLHFARLEGKLAALRHNLAFLAALVSRAEGKTTSDLASLGDEYIRENTNVSDAITPRSLSEEIVAYQLALEEEMSIIFTLAGAYEKSIGS
ncbi:hypothetical protein [Burkholderia perseverans]|uniref:hypothetical protein n=1 Tax=Burkholderia perseverans TaxID=2615214 RepID=UPI001FED5F07|nr:hypothetical protein [Burkholderia perseverans]